MPQHVHGYLQVRGARRAEIALPERHALTSSATRSVLDTVALNFVTGSMIRCGQIAERPPVPLFQRLEPADEEERTLLIEGVRHARVRVRGPRASRTDRTARLAGHTRVPVCRMCGRPPMPHVNDADPLLDTATEDVS